MAKRRGSKTMPGGRKKPITSKQRAARIRNIAIARRQRRKVGNMGQTKKNFEKFKKAGSDLNVTQLKLVARYAHQMYPKFKF